jgi:hypothetical protein
MSFNIKGVYLKRALAGSLLKKIRIKDFGADGGYIGQPKYV